MNVTEILHSVRVESQRCPRCKAFGTVRRKQYYEEGNEAFVTGACIACNFQWNERHSVTMVMESACNPEPQTK